MTFLYVFLVALAAAVTVDLIVLLLVVRWARRQLRSLNLQTMIGGYPKSIRDA